MVRSEGEPRSSITKEWLVKGVEWGGLIGGVIYLLNGNLPAAVVGVTVAFVGYLIGRDSKHISG